MATNRPSLTDRVEVLEQAAEDRGGGISDLRNLSARVDDLETRGEKRAQDTAQQVETLTNRVEKGERDILIARQALHDRVERLEQDRTGGELGELTKGVVYPPQEGTGKGKVIDRLVTELVYRTKGLNPGAFREWLRDLIEHTTPNGIKAFAESISSDAEQYIAERISEVVGTVTTDVMKDAIACVDRRVEQVLEGVELLLKAEPPSAGGRPVPEPKAQYKLSIATIKGGIVRAIVVTADDLPSEYRDTDVKTWGLLEWTAAVAGLLNTGEYVKWTSPV